MAPNLDNLKGHGFDERSAEEVRAAQSKGGVNSGKTRKRKKLLRECLEILLEREAGKDKDGNAITGVEAMAIKAMQGAMNGDWKAWELVRDTAGQKPLEKVAFTEISNEKIEEIEKMVLSRDDE